MDLKDIYKACHGGEEGRLKMEEDHAFGWLIVPFARMANKFDDYQDNILDKVMCTETCPCYRTGANHDAYEKY